MSDKSERVSNDNSGEFNHVCPVQSKSTTSRSGVPDGVASGEFPPCDVKRAAKATQAAAVTMCHPEVVAMKLDDEDRATPEEIAALIINALKNGATVLKT